MGHSQVIDAGWAFAVGALIQRPTSNAEHDAARRMPPDAALDPDRARLVSLIGRMAARDQQALAEFYDATLGKAYGLTLRIVRNAALAEEVLSDAYHQTWRDAARYDSAKSAPMTWLLMICRSRALDALRARDPATLHEDPCSLVPESEELAGDNPLDLLTAVASRRAVGSALQLLAPSQRQMIALAFFRGLSHQEIAEQTQLPLGTVKSQIRRALATLRTALDAE